MQSEIFQAFIMNFMIMDYRYENLFTIFSFSIWGFHNHRNYD